MKYNLLILVLFAVLVAFASQMQHDAEARPSFIFCTPGAGCATNPPASPTPGPLNVVPNNIALSATATPTTAAVTDPNHTGAFTVSPYPQGIVNASITGTGTSATVGISVVGAGTAHINVYDGHNTKLIAVGVATPVPPTPTPAVGPTESAPAVFPSQSPPANDASAPKVVQVCSYAAGTAAGGALISCASPPADGDLLLANIGTNQYGDTGRYVAAPSGWTVLNPILCNYNLNNPCMSLFIKVAASESGSYTFLESAPSNTFTPISGIIYDITNADPTNYLGQYSVQTNYNSSFYMPSGASKTLGPIVAHTLTLWLLAADGGAGISGQSITPGAPLYGWYLDSFAYSLQNATLGAYLQNGGLGNPYSVMTVPNNQSYVTALVNIQPVGAPAPSPSPSPSPSSSPSGSPAPSVTATAYYDNFASDTAGTLPAPYVAFAQPSPSSTPPWQIINSGGTNYLGETSGGAARDLLYVNNSSPFNSLYETYSFTYTGPSSIVAPALVQYPAASPFSYYTVSLAASNSGSATTAGNVTRYNNGGSGSLTALANLPLNNFYQTGHTYRVEAYANPGGNFSARVYDVALGSATYDQSTRSVPAGNAFYPGVVNQFGGAVAINDFGYGPYEGPPIVAQPARRAFDYINYIGEFWSSTTTTPSTYPVTTALATYIPLLYGMHERLTITSGATEPAFNYIQSAVANVGASHYTYDATCLTNNTTTVASLVAFTNQLTNGCANIEMENEPGSGDLNSLAAQSALFASYIAGGQATPSPPIPLPSSLFGPSVIPCYSCGGVFSQSAQNIATALNPTAAPVAQPSPISNYISDWNTHVYTNGPQPETYNNGSGGGGSGCGYLFVNGCTGYGLYSFFINLDSTYAPFLPGVSTEGVGAFGSYYTYPGGGGCGNGNPGNADLNTQQAYYTRGLMYWFKLGLQLATTSFLDDSSNGTCAPPPGGTSASDGFADFGIFNRIQNLDGTVLNVNPKPSAVSMMYMNHLLWDNASNNNNFTTTPLSYSLNGPPDVESLLLEHADSSYYLVLWSDQRMWSGGELTPVTDAVTVYFPANVATRIFTQAYGTGAWSIPSGGTQSSASSVSTTVGFAPQIIQIIPSSSAATPEPVPTGIPTPGIYPTAIPTGTPAPVSAPAVNSDNFDGDTVGQIAPFFVAGAAAQPWAVSTFQPVSSPNAFGESGTPSLTDTADYAFGDYSNTVEEEFSFYPVNVSGTYTAPAGPAFFDAYFSLGYYKTLWYRVNPGTCVVQQYKTGATYISNIASMNVGGCRTTWTAGHEYGFKVKLTTSGSYTTWTSKEWDLSGSEPAYQTPVSGTNLVLPLTCGLQPIVTVPWSIDSFACAWDGGTLPTLPF